jgi:hypothetical protein
MFILEPKRFEKMLNTVSNFVVIYSYFSYNYKDNIKEKIKNDEKNNLEYWYIFMDMYNKYILKNNKIKELIISKINSLYNTKFDIEDLDNALTNDNGYNEDIMKLIFKYDDYFFIGMFYLSLLQKLGYNNVFKEELNHMIKEYDLKI